MRRWIRRMIGTFHHWVTGGKCFYMSLDPEMVEYLGVMKDRIGLPSSGDVLVSSLVLMDILSQSVDEGGEILIRNLDGSFTQVSLVMRKDSVELGG